MPDRLLPLLAAALLGTALLAACGGESTADRHPLETVAASPAVRGAWEAQQVLLAGPAPPAPREAEVRLYYHLRNLLDDRQRRGVAIDHFLNTWTADPQHPLWIDFALTKRGVLGHGDEIAALLVAAAGPDSLAASAEFVRARMAWERRRNDPTVFLQTLAAAHDDTLFRVWVAMRAARTEQAAGEVDAAVTRLVDVLPDAWRVGGATLAGNVWQDLSYVTRRAERLDDALLAGHAAEVCARATGVGYLVTRARLALGRVHLERREYRASLDTFAACRRVAVDSSYYRWAKDASGLMSRTARSSGNADLERTHMLASHEASTSSADTNGIIRTCVALGSLERRGGLWDAAETWFDRAITVNSAWSGPDLASLINLSRSTLLGQQGRYAEAESLLIAGLTASEHGLTGRAELEARLSLIHQGLETGRPDLAYRALAEARKLDLERLPRTAASDPVMQIEVAAARLHARQGEHQLAAAALARAQTRRDQASPDAAWFLAEAEGIAAAEAGDLETARAAFATCETLAREVGNPDLIARSRIQLGANLLALGDPAAAESLFVADLDAPEYWPRLNARLLTGMCLARSGHTGAAVPALAEVDTMLGTDAPLDLRMRLRLEQGRALASLGQADAAWTRLAEARRLRTEQRTTGQTDIGRTFNARIEREIAEEALALLQTHPALPPRGERLSTSHDLAAWGRSGRPPAATDEERRVPRIEFFLGERHAFQWIRPAGDGTAIWRPLGDVDRLVDLAEAVTVDMSYPGRAVDRDAAAELGRLLLDPALPAWAADEVLEILPDGVLDGLPWAALVLQDGSSGLERGAFVVVTDGVGPAVPAAGATALLAVGANESTDTAARGDLDRAEAEAAAVAAVWPDEVDLRLGADTRWSELRAGGAAGYRAIHIASHTRVYEGLDGRSTIHVAGIDDATPLTMPEIPALGADAELIYLSSCEGARRHRAAGSGVTSFAEAFLEAGAGSVVASSVLVDDEAASVLAQAFYRHWLGGKDRAAALRAALLHVRDADPRWDHPFYWAFTNLYRPGS